MDRWEKQGRKNYLCYYDFFLVITILIGPLKWNRLILNLNPTLLTLLIAHIQLYLMFKLSTKNI